MIARSTHRLRPSLPPLSTCVLAFSLTTHTYHQYEHRHKQGHNHHYHYQQPSTSAATQLTGLIAFSRRLAALKVGPRWFSSSSSSSSSSISSSSSSNNKSSSSSGSNKIIYRPPSSSRFVLCHCVLHHAPTTVQLLNCDIFSGAVRRHTRSGLCLLWRRALMSTVLNACAVCLCCVFVLC
jgi:hypothetical protein